MQASELLQRIKSNSAPLVLDARKTRLFKQGHIPGAIHARVPEILLRQVPLPGDKTTELVITCEHGPRSTMVKGILAIYGYRNTTLLKGHMLGWKKAGLPLEK
jgi:hydroxyacylglutathione hydrolase